MKQFENGFSTRNLKSIEERYCDSRNIETFESIFSSYFVVAISRVERAYVHTYMTNFWRGIVTAKLQLSCQELHIIRIRFIMGLCNIECVERIAQYLDVPSKRKEISNKHVSVIINLISIWKQDNFVPHMCKI